MFSTLNNMQIANVGANSDDSSNLAGADSLFFNIIKTPLTVSSPPSSQWHPSTVTERARSSAKETLGGGGVGRK